MILLDFTLLWLLTCYFLFQTTVILSQTIVISFDIFPCPAHNSSEFNNDQDLSQTCSLFFLCFFHLYLLTMIWMSTLFTFNHFTVHHSQFTLLLSSHKFSYSLSYLFNSPLQITRLYSRAFALIMVAQYSTPFANSFHPYFLFLLNSLAY